MKKYLPKQRKPSPPRVKAKKRPTECSPETHEKQLVHEIGLNHIKLKTQLEKLGDEAKILRQKAEKTLQRQAGRLGSLSAKDRQYLVHELGTHQIELEMQNEELRRAQVELETSRRKYVDLYDFAPVGYFTFDKNGLILEANLAGAEMLGMNKRLLIKKPFSSFIENIGDRNTFSAHLVEVFQKKMRGTCELRLKGKDAPFYAQLQSIPAEDEKGGTTLIRAVMSDITKRKRAEEARLESEERFRTLTEKSPDYIALHDKDLRHLYVNPAISRGLGRPQEAFVGKSVWEMGMPREFAEKLDRLLRTTLVTGREQLDELTRPAPDGSRYFQWRSVPLFGRDGSVNAVLAIAADITDRKRAEEAVKTAHEQLESHARALAAANKELEAFAYSVSHDLRAPLRHIEGFIRILMEDYGGKLDDKGRDYLRRVSSGAQRMNDLVNALLSLSSYTRADFKRTKLYLSTMVKAALAERRQSWPERRVELVVAEGVTAEGDPMMLQVVINNLIWNAWKFTQKRSDAKIEFGVSERDGKPVYFVRDNGAGFDKEYADKLFTPFRRLHSDEDFPGLGIGLSIVQRIIHRHRGRIWAEGEVDKGATFYFTLGDGE